MIVFDNGEFTERDIDWIAEEYEQFDGEYACRSIGGEYEARDIRITAHRKRESTYLAEISDPHENVIGILIEGRLNYVKFLASPLCSASDTANRIGELLAIAKAAFVAWHDHDAPDELYDHGIGRSCDQCDPHGISARAEERDWISKWRAERAKKNAPPSLRPPAAEE